MGPPLGCFLFLPPPKLLYLHWYLVAEYICRFYIKDCCSAGGTYIRIAYGVPKPMYPGLMVMLGKHQLVVLTSEGEDTPTCSDTTRDTFEVGNRETAKKDYNPVTPGTSNVNAMTAAEPR